MTALPRGRSKEVGMGTTMLPKKMSQEGPRLSRMNSSSCMFPTSSGSGSSLDKTAKTKQPANEIVVSQNVNMTFTDLFLQDLPELVASDEDKSHRPFVPLPTSVKSTVEKIQRQNSKNIDFVKQQAQSSQQENKLQEYWKSHTLWPSWPNLKVQRERLNEFRDGFREGINSPNLIRHCGEHLKCAAYVVVCTDKIGIRSAPTSDSEKQTGGTLHPGQMVIVDNILTFDGVRYLKLRSGGWVFERKGNTHCMSYMTQVEIGLWWYKVACVEYAEVRCSPNFREAARTGHLLVPGEVIVISLRCSIDGYNWMALADGRGWIFEIRPPIHGLENSAEERVIAECDEQKAREDEQVQNMTTGGVVELGMWEYEVMDQVLAIGSSTSGWLLTAGERILVDMRVPANGLKVKEASSKSTTTIETRIWLRLHDGRGWVPKTHVNGLPSVRFVKVPAPGSQQHPRHSNPSKAEVDEWSGVA